MILKKTIRPIASIVLLLFVAITVFPTGASAATWPQTKLDAIRECSSVKIKLQNWVNDFAVASLKYPNIAAVVGALPALKPTLLSAATDRLAILNNAGAAINPCVVISNAADQAALDAADALPKLKAMNIDNVVIMAFGKINSLDSLYKKYDDLLKNEAYLRLIGRRNPANGGVSQTDNAINYDGNVAVKTAEEGIVERAITVNTNAITKVATLMAAYNAAWFYGAGALPLDFTDDTGVTGSTLDTAKTNIAKLNSSISDASNAINEAKIEFNKAMVALRTVMAQAAMRGEVLNPTDDDYDKYIEKYSKMAKALCENLIGSVTRIKDITLPAASDRVNIAEGNALNELPVAVPNALVAWVTGIIGAPATADSLMDILDNGDGDGLPALAACNTITYEDASAEKVRYENLAIDKSVFPIVQYAINFNKKVTQARNLQAFVDLFNTAEPILTANAFDALDPEETVYITLLATINAALNNANDLGDDVANLGWLDKLLSADKTTIEGLITAHNNITGLKTAVTNYGKLFSQANKRASALRSDWYKIIKAAAIEGRLTLAQKTAAGFDNAEKEAKQFESFEKNRAGYQQRAQAIVDKRLDAVNKRMLNINLIDNIPAAGQVNFVNHVANLTTALNTHNTNNIQNADNYNDIKQAVSDIKNYGVTTVFMKSQEIYMRGSIYYAKLAILKQKVDEARVAIAAKAADPSTPVEVLPLLTGLDAAAQLIYNNAGPAGVVVATETALNTFLATNVDNAVLQSIAGTAADFDMKPIYSTEKSISKQISDSIKDYGDIVRGFNALAKMK